MSSSDSNYFNLFGLPEGYELDQDALDVAYRARQAEHHPDRFAGAPEAERRRAHQIASLLNDAYRSLSSPLHRAAYLLRLRGIDPDAHDQGQLDPAFLLEQMQQREELERLSASGSLEQLDALKARVEEDYEEAKTAFRERFEAQAYPEAKQAFHHLQFLAKLQEEIDRAEEKLLDY